MPRLLKAVVVAGLLFSPARLLAGYAHHYTWKSPPDNDRLRNAIAEMRYFVEFERSRLAGPDGKAKGVA